jgi:hypothetical protein
MDMKILKVLELALILGLLYWGLRSPTRSAEPPKDDSDAPDASPGEREDPDCR